MIEQKLTVGSFIDIGDIAALAPGTPPAEISQGTEARVILRSKHRGWHHMGAKQRTVVAGEHATKERRNFIWLPYAVNQINYATPQGRDVLSGVFTGCWMIRYNSGGAIRVAHVSTPNAAAAWNALAGQATVQPLQGFKPSDFLDAPGAAAQDGDSGLEMFGLITGTGSLFTIGLQRRKEEAATMRRVAFVATAKSKTADELRALPTGGADMT